MNQPLPGPDDLTRCVWCHASPDYLAYHDDEWGFPVADDRALFEKLALEVFQSGLSWRTILAKRANFRAAFLDFDYARVAHFNEPDIARLLTDAGIVRHRGKIEAVVNNARRALELAGECGSLARYFWRFEPAPEKRAIPQTVAVSPESVALSRDLKKRGWKFVGPTTAYAFMQAAGLVNDHAETCAIREAAARARRAFARP